MKTLVTICARGGSKGIPGKNIKPLAGIPLIVYSIRAAVGYQKRMGEVDIAISSDSEEIIASARGCGLDVPYRRPPGLATDEAGKVGAIADVLRYYEELMQTTYAYVLDLDVTSPLRTVDDLFAAYHIIDSDADAYNLFSVSPCGRNPYFAMVERGAQGYYHLVKQPLSDVLSRQSAPKVFDMNGSFYFYRRSFFEKGFRSATTEKSLVYEMPHMCFDLDHAIDFEFMSFLIEKNKLDFILS
ncbi:MAG TPA: acylneuraminate cytidylyltransferase family protein [Bacteroidota bacterium]|nr:acylneuraminate cytidylyltransferase family protein [Bacteroidota bacterium]